MGNTQKLDLLWGKSTASIKWKIRVYDAVIVAKLMYGLAPIPPTKADGRKIDAFQLKGLRKILHIKTLTGLEYSTRNCLKGPMHNSVEN